MADSAYHNFGAFHTIKMIFLFLVFLMSKCIAIDLTGGYFSSLPSHPTLKYYEIIDPSAFSHQIVKRGLKESSHRFNKIKEVAFDAMGRNFRLILNPRKGLLHPQFKSYAIDGEGNEKLIQIDNEEFFEGRVFGEKSSDVTAHLENGIMTATIQTPDDTYHIEPSWRHVPDSDEDSMIIYRGSDVKHSWEDKNPSLKRHKICDFVKEGNESIQDYSEEEMDDDYSIHNAIHRVKRQQSELSNSNIKKTRCSLLLVADYHFFRDMGGSSYRKTVNYLISLIDRVDKIYENTEWHDMNEKSDFKGMGFVIKKILVHQEFTNVSSDQKHYNMVHPSWDVRDLLETFSRESSHKDYCLAHLFTDIKFEGGILGLAYVASPRRNSVGGICTRDYYKDGQKLYLNSGFSSSRTYKDKHVITREADLVTAHEFGHNWGSEHDPDKKECAPSASQGGSHIMYTYSVSGYDINNRLFSPCSVRSIQKVLMSKSSRCFDEPEDSFCGNQRVEAEGQEECDAGLAGQDDMDMCCDKHCKLKDGAVCSDRNSPCCMNCQFKNEDVICRENQTATCDMESRCTGNSAICPEPSDMLDGENCVDRGECLKGTCLRYCETKNKQTCMCDTIENACYRCCRQSLNETCSPIEPLDILPDGTSCIQGFCIKGTCKKTIRDVVERFWDVIEDININKALVILKDNIVGAVIIISVIIWVPFTAALSYADYRRKKKLIKEVEEFNVKNFLQRIDLVY